jgi:hypothetical protein
MWWQRRTTIEVKTHDDLVAALKNAPDEIVIEGDSSVIEQAEKLVISKNAEVLRSYSLETVPAAAIAETIISGAMRAVPARNYVVSILAVLAALLIIGALAFFMFGVNIKAPPPAPPAPPPPPPDGITDLPYHPVSAPTNYVPLGWIAVAMVAIVLVYRVVIKAMQGERDVEISWKITEKVSGKLVITKVQKTTKVSTRRKPKAA